MLKHLIAAVAALTLAAPIAAQAQEVPSYAVQDQQQIEGRVTSFDGAYNLQVRDDNGYTDNIALHDGTVINPTGITLAPGMIVNVLGDNAGSYFAANEIDTPYTFDNAVPYYGGHPWNYYGPSIGLSFFFGNTNWWHQGNGGFYRSNGDRRGVAYNQDTHVDNTVIVNNDNGGRSENRGGDRSVTPVRSEAPQPIKYAPVTQPARPTRFSPPATRTAPVDSAPVERVRLPAPVARVSAPAAPASHYNAAPSHGSGQTHRR